MAHAGGRPLKFQSADEILRKAQAYFDATPPRIQTITGVAIALDTSRETLMNYEKRDKFFDAIKSIKDRIEGAYELTLRERGGAGDIFGLKNFGWSDKQEVQHSNDPENPMPSLIDGNMLNNFISTLKNDTDERATSTETSTD